MLMQDYGNPRVFLGHSCPYLWKPVPTGTTDDCQLKFIKLIYSRLSLNPYLSVKIPAYGLLKIMGYQGNLGGMFNLLTVW